MPGPRLPLTKGPPPSPKKIRGRLLWAAGITLALASVLALAQAHGRASRAWFHPPPELARRPAASVESAAEAFVVWKGSELRGRRLILLTGQWGDPRRDSGNLPARGGVTAASAPYWAARLGLARAFDVVMPPAAFEERRAADSTHKVFRPENGAYRHDLHGFWLRFSLPSALVPPGEPALVLVEPTWFRPGAPPDPLAWLSSLGVQVDLALVALDDPEATDADRLAAATYARGARLPRLQIETTP